MRTVEIGNSTIEEAWGIEHGAEGGTEISLEVGGALRLRLEAKHLCCGEAGLPPLSDED